MIYEIQTYGKKVLRTKTENIPVIDDEVKTLISNMFETMYAAEGIGLAAPQVGRSVRLFVIDISPLEEHEKKRVYINPKIYESGSDKDDYEEGCLSIPTVREIVTRPTTIRIRYQDETGKHFDEEVDGFLARVIQHEYDHLESRLFVDHLSSLKRSLLKKTLQKIASGEIEVETSENYEL